MDKEKQIAFYKDGEAFDWIDPVENVEESPSFIVVKSSRGLYAHEKENIDDYKIYDICAECGSEPDEEYKDLCPRCDVNELDSLIDE